MSYVMLSTPRVGSKYVLQSFSASTSGEYLGEVFEQGNIEEFDLPYDSEWGLKLHSYQCIELGQDKTDSIMNRPDVKRILLYRKDLVDKTLSRIIADHDDIWQVHDSDHLNPTSLIEFTTKVEKQILEVLRQEIQLHQLSKSYDWDYVFCYEDLTGDPEIDFKFDIKSSNLPRKQYSKEQKYKRFKDPKGIITYIKTLAKSMNLNLFNTPEYNLRK